MRRLSTRLAVGTTVGTSLVFAVVLGAVAWFMTERLVELRDRELLRLLRSNAATVFREHSERWRRMPIIRPADVGEGTARSEFYLQAWSAAGETILRQGELDSGDLPRLAEHQPAVRIRDLSTADATLADLTLPTGTPGRGAGSRFTVPDRSRGGRLMGAYVDLELVVAVDDEGLDRTIARLIWLLAIGWGVASLTGALILSLLTRRNLRPLHALVDQIESGGGDAEGHAFALRDPPAELAPVVARLNEFVTRLRAALTHERAFASAAAHELRTPIAGLRATLEVALRRERSGAELEDSARRCLDIVVEMEAMVESLLHLARRGHTGRDAVDIDLAELVADSWAAHGGASPHALALDCAIEPGVVVRSDRPMVSRVIDNLLANAAAYADAGTTVDVRATRCDGEIVFEVENAVSDAPADLAERAFEPFWRGRGERGEPHLGIGLTLSRRVAEALGGTLTARLDTGRFLAELRLPRAARKRR